MTSLPSDHFHMCHSVALRTVTLWWDHHHQPSTGLFILESAPLRPSNNSSPLLLDWHRCFTCMYASDCCRHLIHMRAITQYAVFLRLAGSLSITSSRFIHILCSVRQNLLFLFKARWYSIVCI